MHDIDWGSKKKSKFIRYFPLDRSIKSEENFNLKVVSRESISKLIKILNNPDINSYMSMAKIGGSDEKGISMAPSKNQSTRCLGTNFSE